MSPEPDLEDLRRPAHQVAADWGLELREPFRWIGDQVPGWLTNAGRSADTNPQLLALAREFYASLEVGRSTLGARRPPSPQHPRRRRRRHLAIDPKPMLGEPEFDVAPFLWNPIGARMSLDVAEGRLAAFAAAGLD